MSSASSRRKQQRPRHLLASEEGEAALAMCSTADPSCDNAEECSGNGVEEGELQLNNYGVSSTNVAPSFYTSAGGVPNLNDLGALLKNLAKDEHCTDEMACTNNNLCSLNPSLLESMLPPGLNLPDIDLSSIASDRSGSADLTQLQQALMTIQQQQLSQLQLIQKLFSQISGIDQKPEKLLKPVPIYSGSETSSQSSYCTTLNTKRLCNAIQSGRISKLEMLSKRLLNCCHSTSTHKTGASESEFESGVSPLDLRRTSSEQEQISPDFDGGVESCAEFQCEMCGHEFESADELRDHEDEHLSRDFFVRPKSYPTIAVAGEITRPQSPSAKSDPGTYDIGSVTDLLDEEQSSEFFKNSAQFPPDLSGSGSGSSLSPESQFQEYLRKQQEQFFQSGPGSGIPFNPSSIFAPTHPPFLRFPSSSGPQIPGCFPPPPFGPPGSFEFYARAAAAGGLPKIMSSPSMAPRLPVSTALGSGAGSNGHLQPSSMDFWKSANFPTLQNGGMLMDFGGPSSTGTPLQHSSSAASLYTMSDVNQLSKSLSQRSMVGGSGGEDDDDWESMMEVTLSDENEKLQKLVDKLDNRKTVDTNQCIICQRILSCKSALQMHYRTHTGERPFKCKICLRAFTTKGNLKTHMGVHRTKPPMRLFHQCPVCHRRFSNGMLLHQHLQTHTSPGGRSMGNAKPLATVRTPSMTPSSSSTSTTRDIKPPVLTPNKPPQLGGFNGFPQNGNNAALNRLFFGPQTPAPPLFPSFPGLLGPIISSHVSMPAPSLAISATAAAKPPVTMPTPPISVKVEAKPESAPKPILPMVASIKSEPQPHPITNSPLTTASNGSTVPKLPSVTASTTTNRNAAAAKEGLKGFAHALPMPNSNPFSPVMLPTPKQVAMISGRPNTTCNICFKTFACNSALEIHYRSHTKERPFKCNVCGRGFSTKGNMKQHLLTHKIRDLPQNSGGEESSGRCSGFSEDFCRRQENRENNRFGTGYSSNPTSPFNNGPSSVDSFFRKKRPLQTDEMETTNSPPPQIYKLENGSVGSSDEEPANLTRDSCLSQNSLSNNSAPGYFTPDLKTEPLEEAANLEDGMESEEPIESDHHDSSEALPPDEHQSSYDACNELTVSQLECESAVVRKPAESLSPLESIRKMWDKTEPGPAPWRPPTLAKHQCQVCYKHFSSASALQIHMRTHTGDKPFKCEMCERAFTTKGNLKVHMGTHMFNQQGRRGRRTMDDNSPSRGTPAPVLPFGHGFPIAMNSLHAPNTPLGQRHMIPSLRNGVQNGGSSLNNDFEPISHPGTPESNGNATSMEDNKNSIGSEIKIAGSGGANEKSGNAVSRNTPGGGVPQNSLFPSSQKQPSCKNDNKHQSGPSGFMSGLLGFGNGELNGHFPGSGKMYPFLNGGTLGFPVANPFFPEAFPGAAGPMAMFGRFNPGPFPSPGMFPSFSGPFSPVGQFSPTGAPAAGPPSVSGFAWRTVCSVCSHVCGSQIELEEHLKQHIASGSENMVRACAEAKL